MRRINPKTSCVRIVCVFPLLGSGLSSSRRLLRATMISCCFVPEKLPWIAWLMADVGLTVRLYKNMASDVPIEKRSSSSRSWKERVWLSWTSNVSCKSRRLWHIPLDMISKRMLPSIPCKVAKLRNAYTIMTIHFIQLLYVNSYLSLKEILIFYMTYIIHLDKRHALLFNETGDPIQMVTRKSVRYLNLMMIMMVKYKVVVLES